MNFTNRFEVAFVTDIVFIVYFVAFVTEGHFLFNYVEERPWWPIQSPNNGRKKKAKG